MGKNTWIFHHYATPPSLGGMSRAYEFGKRLIDAGQECTVFSSAYLHYTLENLIDNKASFVEYRENDVPFIFVRSSKYEGNGFTRLKNMFSFTFNLKKIAKNLRKKGNIPDIIYASSPHPLTVILGIILAKKWGIPVITEYRDLWPEAIFKYSSLREKGLIGRFLIAGEHWMYKNSDAIIFLKEGDTDYLKDKKWTREEGGDIDLNKCYYINNGVDIKMFEKQIKDNHFKDEDLESDKFNVVYTGAIRPVNNIGNILDTAHLLKDLDDIQFLIYGEGSELPYLKERIKNEGLDNVKLKGYVDKRNIPNVLHKSSVNLLNYSQDKYNWSRGSSSNKLFEYMASAKPVISTVKIGYNPLEKYNCGITLENDTPEDLAEAIKHIYNLDEEDYREMGENARLGARDYDYDIQAKKLLDLVESL